MTVSRRVRRASRSASAPYRRASRSRWSETAWTRLQDRKDFSSAGSVSRLATVSIVLAASCAISDPLLVGGRRMRRGGASRRRRSYTFASGDAMTALEAELRAEPAARCRIADTTGRGARHIRDRTSLARDSRGGRKRTASAHQPLPFGPRLLERVPDGEAFLARDAADLVELRRHRHDPPIEPRHLVRERS
jgi:hypothetical protein